MNWKGKTLFVISRSLLYKELLNIALKIRIDQILAKTILAIHHATQKQVHYSQFIFDSKGV